MHRALTAIAALTLSSAPLAAQQASALRVGVTTPVQPHHGLYRERPDTFPPHPKNTYWKEGALIFGVPTALIFYSWGRAMEESTTTSIAGGISAGLISGALGALIGWQIAKPEQPAAEVAN
jgi:hypothetical protein